MAYGGASAARCSRYSLNAPCCPVEEMKRSVSRMAWSTSFSLAESASSRSVREELSCAVQLLLETREFISRLFDGAEWRASDRLETLAEVLEAIRLASRVDEAKRISCQPQEPSMFGRWMLAPLFPNRFLCVAQIVQGPGHHGFTSASWTPAGSSEDTIRTAGTRTNAAPPLPTAIATKATPAMTTAVPTSSSSWCCFNQATALSAVENFRASACSRSSLQSI